MTLRDRLQQAHAAGHARAIDLVTEDSPSLDRLVGGTPAAVLMAVTDSARPGMILTQRPQTMRKHPGQVAFPGGRIDPEDADAFAAALREAEEEVGLSPHLVDIIGPADVYRTGTGFEITPVLAVIPGDVQLVRNEDEVDAIFEAPLDFLFDPANHKEHTVQWGGGLRSYYEMYWEGHRIWGVTAGIIVTLSRRLAWSG